MADRSKSELESIIEKSVYRALLRANRSAFILGEPGVGEDVLLDGHFNFRVMAWSLRRDFERLGLLMK